MSDDSLMEFLAWLRMRFPESSAEHIRRDLPRIESYLKLRPDLNAYLGVILSKFEFNMWSGWVGRTFEDITLEGCRTHQMRLLALAAEDILSFMNDPRYQYRTSEQPPVSIIIPAWNQWEFTHLTLSTLFSKTVWPEFEVVVVDNGSGDDTSRELAILAGAQPRLRVIRNERNLGFSGANNQGAKAARHDHLIFLNNDIKIHHADWIGQMMRSFLVHPDVGATGQFAVLDCFDGDHEELYQKVFFPGASVPVSWISGYNLMTTKQILSEAGGWRGDLYGAAGYEDIHLGYAIRASGRLCVSPCEIPLIEHLIGKTRFTDAGKSFVAAHSPAEDKHRIFCRYFGSRQFQPALRPAA